MTATAFAGLALPVLLGLIAGRLALFADPEAAIGHLNRYALYIAFPALIVAGLTDAAFRFPGQPWFWGVVPVGMLVTVGILGVVGRGTARGTLALVSCFGNVAYIGLPLCVAVLGPEVLGTTALAVSLYVLCSLLIGPVLLVRWGGGSGSDSIGLVLRQPLFWSPFVGVGLRVAPTDALAALNTLISPIGASAAPVALFLLGLYLWENRGRVGEGRGSALAHVAAKMVLLPAVVAALVMGALQLGWSDGQSARILLLLSTMPTAIATFALAQDLGVGRQAVAQTIVGSTLLAGASLPFAVQAVLWVIPG